MKKLKKDSTYIQSERLAFGLGKVVNELKANRSTNVHFIKCTFTDQIRKPPRIGVARRFLARVREAVAENKRLEPRRDNLRRRAIKITP